MINSFIITSIIVLFIIVLSLAFYQILYLNRHKYYRDSIKNDINLSNPRNINTENCPRGCNRNRKCPEGYKCNNCKPGNMECCCYDWQCKKCN